MAAHRLGRLSRDLGVVLGLAPARFFCAWQATADAIGACASPYTAANRASFATSFPGHRQIGRHPGCHVGELAEPLRPADTVLKPIAAQAAGMRCTSAVGADAVIGAGGWARGMSVSSCSAAIRWPLTVRRAAYGKSDNRASARSVDGVTLGAWSCDRRLHASGDLDGDQVAIAAVDAVNG